MNFFKSIQHIVLASLVMTAGMPTIAGAMSRNQRGTQKRMQVKSKTNAPAKGKKTVLQRIKDNWEYVALGGCALVALAAVLWNLNRTNKGLGNNNGQKPNQQPRPNIVAVDKDDPDLVIKDGDCAVCFEHTNDRTPCCNNPVCRPCWNQPVTGGDAEFVDENLGLRIPDKGKVLPKACPLCRKAHR